jgi:hypothetical protein
MKLVLNKSNVELTPRLPELLIVGDGVLLEVDLVNYLSMKRDHETMSVGRSYQKIDGECRHWANVDAAEAKWWADNLPAINQGGKPVRHTIGEYPWMDVAWDVAEGDQLWNPAEVLWHGSSALFGVYIGLVMGYERIVLAGCPMDSRGHWYDRRPGPRWTAEGYQAWLDFARTPESRRVESLSGYTKQILRGGFVV